MIYCYRIKNLKEKFLPLLALRMCSSKCGFGLKPRLGMTNNLSRIWPGKRNVLISLDATSNFEENALCCEY